MGFTLIELLVVLAILSLLAVIVVPNISDRPAGIARQENGARLIDALRRARADAITTGTVARVDPGAIVAGAVYEPAISSGPSPATIAFHPDGSSTGGIVTQAGRPMIAIDWLTGVAHDAR
jgi:prepilin-type N-terminal cleavage/methylation domain-containing protein